MRLSVFAPAAVFCLLPLAGCGGSDPPPNDPNQYAANQGQYPGGQPGAYPGGQPGQYPPGGYPGGQPGQYQQPGGQPGQYQQPGTQPGQYQQPGTQPGTQPGAQPGTQPASGTGQASPIPMAAMLTPVLQGMAAAEVPGMQPDGQAFAGQFQEGQTLEQPLNIQPGKCYSVVGASAGIQQLDIQIVAQPAPMLPPVVLAQSNTSGGNATLGGKSAGCWKNPTPIGGPGKVIVKATRGAGAAAAQVFVK
jgi:hypothetical protein